MSVYVAEKMGAAETLPPELLRYALAVQYGYELHWSAMRALLRNGLISRRYGTWVLTTVGLSAAGIARGALETGSLSMDGIVDPNNPQSTPVNTVPVDEQAAAANVFTQPPLLDDAWSQRTIGIETGRFSLGEDAGDFEEGGMSLPQHASAPDPQTDETESVEELAHLIPGLVSDEAMQGTTGADDDPLPDGELGMSFAVTQNPSGWRWTAISSTGYRDTDGELITRAALGEDVERANRDRDFGPLVWWHEYEPLLTHESTGQHLLYEAIVLGTCDFNAMAGPEGQFLLESGTFINEQVAQAVANNAHKLAISIKFTYEDHDLDADGVYHRIRRRERSLLPRGREANIFTSLVM